MSTKIFTKFKHLKDDTDPDSKEVRNSGYESKDSIDTLSINDILSEDRSNLDKMVFKMDTGNQENETLKYVKLEVKKYHLNANEH
jgi:hypothetical protein